MVAGPAFRARATSGVDVQLAGADPQEESTPIRQIFPSPIFPVGDVVVELSARPFALLTVHLRNQGRVVGLPTLLRALESYGTDDFNALRVLVSKLRKVLGTGPSRPTIETEVGVGFRMAAPVTDAL